MIDYGSIILSIHRVREICDNKIYAAHKDIKDYNKQLRTLEAELEDMRQRQYQGPYVAISIQNKALQIQDLRENISKRKSSMEYTTMVDKTLSQIVGLLQNQIVNIDYQRVTESVCCAIILCNTKIDFYKSKNFQHNTIISNIEKANRGAQPIDTSGIRSIIAKNDKVIARYVQDIENLNTAMQIVKSKQRLNIINAYVHKQPTVLVH